MVGTIRFQRPRGWRAVVSAAALAGGAAVVAGCLLPWITAFAGLVTIAGTVGDNGKALTAAGILIAAAGLWHLITSSTAARWAIGVLGVGVAGYSGNLLIRLASSLRGGDSMMLLRGGPGLWVVAAGGLLAFATLFLPAPAPASTAPASTAPASTAPASTAPAPASTEPARDS
jgi:hypothetical protein